MCGIAGAVSLSGVDPEAVVEMRDELSHRGPDGAGLYLNENDTAALGHRRLAIIDPSDDGSQPIPDETGDIWLTYNGEIYNHQSLREELENAGHEFTSSTDSEVIVHGYEEWGIDCLTRFNGMYAFALWDEQSGELFAARDRLGIKPFHYYFDGNRLLFASELKGILADPSVPREIDSDALRHYFVYRYIPAPLSIWKDVRKLRPGEYLTYDGTSLEIDTYWQLENSNRSPETTESEAIDQVESLLTDSVERRLMSDVPLGGLLSGGVDSSTIVALMSQTVESPSTFSIGFDIAETDELPFARTIAEAFDTSHTERVLSLEYMDERLDDLLYHYDEPLGDSSIFPTFLLMDAVSDDLTVALSGDGGDEVFAGYTWYRRYNRYQRLESFAGPLGACFTLVDSLPERFDNQLLEELRFHLEPFTWPEPARYRRVMCPRFEPDEITDLLGDSLSAPSGDTGTVFDRAEEKLDSVKNLQYTDARTFLPDDILVKVDRASMAHSLEVRVPMLDHRLVEYVFGLPESLVYGGTETKQLLKQTARRKLPHDIVDREKEGFSAPLEELSFFEEYGSVLADSKAVQDGVLDSNMVEEYIEADEKPDEGRRWLLILFELWYRKWGPAD